MLYAAPGSYAQDPQFFSYNDENGLPSNEVYSMLQDEKGFIWFGCDAGLYKFDGVHYIAYKCKSQQSKAVSGLTLSTSGKLYCCNFQSQIFYLENDTLYELDYPFSTILHLTCDHAGNLLVNHSKGFAVYNETQKQWTNYDNFGESHTATRSARTNNRNETCFLTNSGVGIFANQQLKIILPEEKSSASFSSEYVAEWWNDEYWIFPFFAENAIYRCANDKVVVVKNERLLQVLRGKRINDVKKLADGNLWICSYDGIIRYNPANDSATVFYPGHSFSDCLVDREGNYWFTTLQSGIMRVPNLEHRVWNSSGNSKITHLATDGTHVYFSTINGEIGSLNTHTHELKIVHAAEKADIQCFNYVAADSCLYFFINKKLYVLKNSNVRLISDNFSAVKFVSRINDEYMTCTSSGTYVSNTEIDGQRVQLTSNWSRQALHSACTGDTWIATNNGLLKFSQADGNRKQDTTFFVNSQILSIDFDSTTQQLFVLAFDGKIYTVDSQNKCTLVARLPTDVQPYTIHHRDRQFFIATNKGLWIFSTETKNYETLNLLSGLASPGVQDVVLLDGQVWLATGKGIQKILPDQIKKSPRAKLYLKNKNLPLDDVQLEYGQPLVLYPEASIYSSNGNFQYAYRIRSSDTSWSFLPSSVDQIELHAIPAGAFEAELKVIDHLGRDSENTIIIRGTIHPPFWKTWWFIALMILILLVMAGLIFRRQWIKQQRVLQQQNELNALRLIAIQSQMNPHFIFNALNSIQDLILKGDVENSYSYITTFSNLVRRTLNYSDKDFIDFDQELKLLELYLSLEQLRFKKELSYTVDTDGISDIQVPPMLIQPFIENALVHGLLHKTGQKKLHIYFRLNDTLQCTIDDNGIGREKSAEIKKRQQKEHASFATQAIHKRFELLSKHYPGQLGYRYEDLHENSMATGTRVILNIPFRYKY